MSTELAAKINVVVEWLEPLWDNAKKCGVIQVDGRAATANLDLPSISLEELKRLKALTRRIYELARNSDLGDELPEPPVGEEYETKLKLRGQTIGNRFYFRPTKLWFEALRVVADLAENGSGQRDKGKPGRKSTEEMDSKIYDEYYDGLEASRWKTQAEYLRTRHKNRWDSNPQAAKSWLSTLLKREDNRRTS